MNLKELFDYLDLSYDATLDDVEKRKSELKIGRSKSLKKIFESYHQNMDDLNLLDIAGKAISLYDEELKNSDTHSPRNILSNRHALQNDIDSFCYVVKLIKELDVKIPEVCPITGELSSHVVNYPMVKNDFDFSGITYLYKVITRKYEIPLFCDGDLRKLKRYMFIREKNKILYMYFKNKKCADAFAIANNTIYGPCSQKRLIFNKFCFAFQKHPFVYIWLILIIGIASYMYYMLY